jgi:hypothetical protein
VKAKRGDTGHDLRGKELTSDKKNKKQESAKEQKM